jgi:pimeloyl-ACP methyl ester carboxylesterase
MACVERGQPRVYGNSLGPGEPVALVMGLGCRSALWFRLAPTLARADQAQLDGLIFWAAYLHLLQVQAPTLVVPGLQDELIPTANGRLIANRIPGAPLVGLEAASHWLMTDSNAACLRALNEHLPRNQAS